MNSRKRSRVLKIAVLFAMGIIVFKLFFIQIIQHGEWVAKAAEQHTMQNTILAKRGQIYMMDGNEPTVIVMNEPVWSIILDPMIADEEKTKEIVDKYAKEQKIAEWEDVFADKERRYYIVARGIKREAAENIKKEGLPGVWFQESVRRVYPEGQMAAPLLGFVNMEGKGQYGVEGALDNDLAGTNGVLKTIKDVNNIPLTIGSDNIRVPAIDGKDIVLTIDRNIQHSAEKALANALERSGASHASALVMDPRTGKVWAMANLPTYDAANYTNVKDATVFQNGVVEDAYEPASVCKTFTFAAAIEEKAMTPNSTYENTGSLTIDGWPINNAYHGQYGTITMQTALNYSLNTGSMQALMWLGGNGGQITQAGREKLYDYYYKRFGFGQYTGVELYESPGIIIGPNDGYGLNSRYANMTFGQNLNVTMMQVAAAFSAVVNGGEYFTPTIVAGEMVNDEFKKLPLRDSVRQVISTETSSTMRQMLYNTRQGRRLTGIDKPGYYVGGKTGTAQAIRDGAYVMDETKATYIGFGTSGNSSDSDLPEYVIMVKIWEEGKRIEGERDALPIFDEISNFMQDYLKIKPKE